MMTLSYMDVEWTVRYQDGGRTRQRAEQIDPTNFIGLDRNKAEDLLHEIMGEAFRARVDPAKIRQCDWEYDDLDASLSQIMDMAAAIERSLKRREKRA